MTTKLIKRTIAVDDLLARYKNVIEDWLTDPEVKEDFEVMVSEYDELDQESETICNNLAFTLYVNGELKDDRFDFIAPKYFSSYVVGQHLFKKMRYTGIWILRSFDGETTVKARIVSDLGVLGINVGLPEQELPKKGKSRLMSKWDIVNYLGQFVIVEKLP